MEKSDPEGGRNLLISRILEDLHRLDRAHDQEDRLAVAWFGDAIGDSVSMRPVRELQLDMHPRVPVSFTDFVPAFDFALAELQRPPLDESRRRAILVLTDAFPQSQGGRFTLDAQAEHFTHNGPIDIRIRRLESNGIEIKLVGIGPKAIKYEPLWRKVLDKDGMILVDSPPSPSQLDEISNFVFSPKRPPRFRLDQTSLPTAPVGNSEAAPLDNDVPSAATRIAVPKSSKWLFGLLTIFAAISCYLLKVNLDQRRRLESRVLGDPAVAAEVEELKEQAREAVAEENMEKAKEFYEEALIKIVDLGREADEASKAEISEIVSEMLLKLCGTVEEERRLIQEQLVKSQENELKERERIARGMAPMLLRRWADNQDILLLEFDLFRTGPLGKFILEGLIEVCISVDNSQALLQGAVQRLAKSARDLNLLVET
jgi:hypothetical protein